MIKNNDLDEFLDFLIRKHGEERVKIHLLNFKKDPHRHNRDLTLVKSLFKITLKEFNQTKEILEIKYKSKATGIRKIIAHHLHTYFTFTPAYISSLLDVHITNYYQYINYAKNMLANPHFDLKLHKKYMEINKKFKEEIEKSKNKTKWQ